MTVAAPVPATAAAAADCGRRMLGDGLALSLTVGVASLAGMVSWVIAARLMPQSELGVASAFVSAVLLVAGCSQLNLGVAVLRWLPGAGRRSGRMLMCCTVAITLVAAVIAVGYLLLVPGAGLVVRATAGATGGVALGAMVFIATAVGWGLFQFQDYVLVGLGRPWWAPVRTAVFAAARIGVLVAFGASLTAAGVAWSWLLPVALCVLGAGALVVRFTACDRRRPVPRPGTLPDRREVLGFLGTTYPGTLGATVFYNQVPLLVTFRFGPKIGAVFFLAWQAVTVVAVVATYFVNALVVEIARHPEQAEALCREARRRLLALFLPALAVGILVARPVLSIFGADYTQAAPMLRVLLVGAAFRLLVVHALAARQAVGDGVGFARLQLVSTAMVLGAVALVPARAEVEGQGVLVTVALAYLAVQAVVAGVVLLPHSSLRRRRRSAATATDPAP